MADFATASEPTEKLYLLDTYLYSANSVVVSHEVTDEDSGVGWLILASTCFSAQGGGQPSDEGTITVDGEVFNVKQAKINEKDQVVHNGSAPATFWAALTSLSTPVATLKVDERLRRIYSRLHSAGHVLDIAMQNIGMSADRLLGVKGYHFLDGPFVEYTLKGEVLTPEEMAELPGKLTTELRKLVAEDIPSVVEMVDREQVSAVCGTDVRHVDFSHYPQTVRMVKIANMWIPCGGTHVKSTGELGMEIEATKIKKKKQQYKVSYTISIPPAE